MVEIHGSRHGSSNCFQNNPFRYFILPHPNYQARYGTRFGLREELEGVVSATMLGRYATELTKLSDTFAWAASANLKPLRHAIRNAGCSPLRAIGSGGSLTNAHALANLHQFYTGSLAAVTTPLAAVDEPLDSTVTTWLISAGGGNVDIVTAAKMLIVREPRQIGVLCGRDTSPLAKLCRRHPFVDLLVYPPPSGRDGFLATNSLFGFTILLTRSYIAEFGSDTDWKDTADCVDALLSSSAADTVAWEAATKALWARPTTLVLHGSSTRIGAIDLESKFTEAAIGNLQIADYRNFAHGRHHWLAKRSDTSGVLAFITDRDRDIAERTLNLLPTDVPQARLVFAGGAINTALASLISALRITGWAGAARDIDPGRPGVPEFGRKLYRLSLPRRSVTKGLPTLTRRDAAAITRKANADPASLASRGELEHWRNALEDFRNRLCNTQFGGIVLDYDGTVVDTRHRYLPATKEMAAALTRLTETGALVAFATGRGASVRRDLQRRVPHELWPHILIGYYNGAELASLDDDSAPDGSHNACAALQPISTSLRSQHQLAVYVRQEDRPFQITLEPVHIMPDGWLWDIVREVLEQTNTTDVTITRSGHSVDILAPGVSKLNTVRRLRETVGDLPILAIGDRGRWPGNDCELLREPFALGVDEVNTDPTTCWHIGKPGQRGPAVTIDYLDSLEVIDRRLKFAPGSLR